KARLAANASDIAAGVGKLAQTALASGSGPGGAAPRVLLLGLPRLGAGLSPEVAGAEEKAAELPRLLAEQAASLGGDLLALGEVTYSALDGIHLDAEGHSAIGEIVARRLASMF